MQRTSRCPLCAKSGPKADITSLDHLVGAGEQLRWHREAERFGGFEVDHRLKLSGLHYWTTGRLAGFSEREKTMAHFEAGGRY